MERCWDDEGYARLTAHCVEEQIKQLIKCPPDNTFDQTTLDKLRDKTNEMKSSIGLQRKLTLDTNRGTLTLLA